MATSAPPPGVWNHSLDYRGNGVVAGGIVMVAAAAVTVGCRLYSRFAIVKQPGLEEAWICLALAASIVTLVTYVKMHQYGLGHHASELSMQQIGEFFKWFWVCIWIYNVGLTSVKFSILFQYKRIFVSPGFQISVKVMLSLLTVYGLWTFLGCVFICWPVSKFWAPQTPGHCMPQWPIFYANSYMNIVTDLMIILSPLPALTQLHMPNRQKVALSGIFLVGAFVCVISIVRLVLLYQAQNEADFSYVNVKPALWSIVEVNIAIITSSAPALKPLVVRVFPNFGSTRSGTNSKHMNASRSQAADRSRVTNNMTGHDDRDLEMASGGIMGRAGRRDEDEAALVDGKINILTTVTAEVGSDSSSTHSRDGTRHQNQTAPFG